MSESSYQQQALVGATGVELVVALYDGVIRFLYRAMQCAGRGGCSRASYCGEEGGRYSDVPSGSVASGSGRRCCCCSLGLLCGYVHPDAGGLASGIGGAVSGGDLVCPQCPGRVGYCCSRSGGGQGSTAGASHAGGEVRSGRCGAGGPGECFAVVGLDPTPLGYLFAKIVFLKGLGVGVSVKSSKQKGYG